jgi:hypothetical protein
MGCLPLLKRDDCYNHSETGKEDITPESLYLPFGVL